MKKKFVTNLILLIFLNLLIKPFWVLGIDLGVQNAVGAEKYGLYFSLFNLSLVLNILLDLGITNFNNRNISQHHFLLSKHLSNILVLKFSLGILYTVICVIIGLILGYSSEQFELLIFLIFNQFLLSLILYLRSNLSGLHLFRTDSLVSVLDRLIMIVLCGLVLWGKIFGNEFRIEWFVYIQTISYVIAVLIAFLIVASKSQFVRLKWDRKFFLIILRRSYPFAILALMMSFYNRFDSVLIERLLPDGYEQAGIYAQAFRLLDSASMIAFLFAGLLLPIFSKMIKLKENVNQLLKLSYLLIIIPAFILVVSCVFYRTEIMDLFYKEHVETSSVVFSILICSFIPVSTTYIFGTLLTANGDLRHLNIMVSVAMVLNIILNLILIPHYKATGSAIASLTTQSLTALGQVFLAKRFFKFRFRYNMIFAVILFVAGLITLGYISHFYIHFWLTGFIFISVSGFIIAVLTRLISPKAIYKIIKYEEQ